MTAERLYHVYVRNERTGTEARMSAAPVTHSQGCAWLSKIANYPWRRKFLRELTA